MPVAGRQMRKVKIMDMNHVKMIQKIAPECMLFNDIDKHELSEMLVCLNFRVRSCKRNDIVNMAGDHFEGVGVVVDGQAAVVKESASGEKIILTILRPGELFGEMAAFTGSRTWPATVIAQTDCTVMYVPAEKLVGQCANSCMGHRKLIMNMLGILAKKAMTLNRQLEYLSIRSIRGRIANYLLEQQKRSGTSTFMLPLNRNELAGFLNVTRPSLSREMCRMRDEGMLDFHRSSVRILDMDALMAAAQGQ